MIEEPWVLLDWSHTMDVGKHDIRESYIPVPSIASSSIEKKSCCTQNRNKKGSCHSVFKGESSITLLKKATKSIDIRLSDGNNQCYQSLIYHASELT